MTEDELSQLPFGYEKPSGSFSNDDFYPEQEYTWDELSAEEQEYALMQNYY